MRVRLDEELLAAQETFLIGNQKFSLKPRGELEVSSRADPALPSTFSLAPVVVKWWVAGDILIEELKVLFAIKQ